MEALLTIAGAFLIGAVGAFGGGRVNSAKAHKDLQRIEDKADAHAKSLSEKIDGLSMRIDRLEKPYFNRGTDRP